MTAAHLKYLAGYPENLVDQVRACLGDGSLGERLLRRYPQPHTVRNDGALYDYVSELKASRLKNAPPLSKVVWDGKLASLRNALGTHFVTGMAGSSPRFPHNRLIAADEVDAPIPGLLVGGVNADREDNHAPGSTALTTLRLTP